MGFLKSIMCLCLPTGRWATLCVVGNKITTSSCRRLRTLTAMFTIEQSKVSITPSNIQQQVPSRALYHHNNNSAGCQVSTNGNVYSMGYCIFDFTVHLSTINKTSSFAHFARSATSSVAYASNLAQRCCAPRLGLLQPHAIRGPYSVTNRNNFT